MATKKAVKFHVTAFPHDPERMLFEVEPNRVSKAHATRVARLFASGLGEYRNEWRISRFGTDGSKANFDFEANAFVEARSE